MVAELAHELNQPLSAICSYAQACKRLLDSDDRTTAEELSASLNQVSEQADRAAEIIRRLRRFVAKAKPLQVVVDINAMIRDVAELMNIDARMAQAEVALELTEPLPPVVGDRIQLEQVLVNLMRNGFEALRESDARAAAADRPHGGRRPQNVVVDVEDNGVGIAAGSGRSRLRSILHHQARRHGHGVVDQPIDYRKPRGKLWVAPAAERGAVFRFTLPIDTGEHNRGN